MVNNSRQIVVGAAEAPILIEEDGQLRFRKKTDGDMNRDSIAFMTMIIRKYSNIEVSYFNF